MARRGEIDLEKLLDHIFVRIMGAGSVVVGAIGVIGGVLVLISTALGTREKWFWIAGVGLVVLGTIFLMVAKLAFTSYVRDMERRQAAAEERRARRRALLREQHPPTAPHA